MTNKIHLIYIRLNLNIIRKQYATMLKMQKTTIESEAKKTQAGIGGFALLNEKADKKEVTRIEDRIETQIADVKKDLKEDIGEVKKRVDDIFKIVSDK